MGSSRSRSAELKRGRDVATKNYHRRRGVWRLSHRQGFKEYASRNSFDRPQQSPLVSTFALPGGDLGADAKSDCNANPQHFSETEEHHGDPRRSLGSG